MNATRTYVHPLPRPVAKDVIIQSDYDYITFPGLNNERAITVRFREQRLLSHQCGFNRQTLYETFILTISNYMIKKITALLVYGTFV